MDILDTIKKAAPIGAIAGIMSVLVFWILGKLNITAITIPFSTVTIGREPAGLPIAARIFAPLGLNFAQADLTGSLIAAAVAGAVFVSLGLILYDAINLKAKDNQMKLFYILIIAAVAGGWIAAMKLSIPVWTTMVPLAINAYLASYILNIAGMKV